MWAEVGRSRQSVEDSRLLSFDLKLNIITCLLFASCPYRTQQSRPSLLLPMVMLLCTMLQVLDLARRSSLTALSFADPDFGDNPICSLRLGHVKNLGGSPVPARDMSCLLRRRCFLEGPNWGEILTQTHLVLQYRRGQQLLPRQLPILPRTKVVRLEHGCKMAIW